MGRWKQYRADARREAELTQDFPRSNGVGSGSPRGLDREYLALIRGSCETPTPIDGDNQADVESPRRHFVHTPKMRRESPMPYMPEDRGYYSERAEQLKEVYDSLTPQQREQLMRALDKRIEAMGRQIEELEKHVASVGWRRPRRLGGSWICRGWMKALLCH